MNTTTTFAIDNTSNKQDTVARPAMAEICVADEKLAQLDIFTPPNSKKNGAFSQSHQNIVPAVMTLTHSKSY